MSFNRIWRFSGSVLYGLGLVAGLSTAVMMVLVVGNVLARYLLNSPIDGAFEITQSLLTAIVFLSLAFTQHGDGHIRVMLLTRRLPPRVQQVLRIFALLLGAVFFAWCSYATWGFAMESYRTNEQEWGSIQYPIYPVKFLVVFGVALLSLQFLLGAVREVYKGPVAEGAA